MTANYTLQDFGLSTPPATTMGDLGKHAPYESILQGIRNPYNRMTSFNDAINTYQTKQNALLNKINGMYGQADKVTNPNSKYFGHIKNLVNAYSQNLGKAPTIDTYFPGLTTAKANDNTSSLYPTLPYNNPLNFNNNNFNNNDPLHLGINTQPQTALPNFGDITKSINTFDPSQINLDPSYYANMSNTDMLKYLQNTYHTNHPVVATGAASGLDTLNNTNTSALNTLNNTQP
jgi:hypothetical protein